MTVTLEDLYPDATDEERAEAERRFEAYIRIVIAIARKEIDGSADNP